MEIITKGMYTKLEIRVRSNPSPVSQFLYLLKYPREAFENANICIFPTFQETVGSHLKPSLIMASGCYGNIK